MIEMKCLESADMVPYEYRDCVRGIYEEMETSLEGIADGYKPERDGPIVFVENDIDDIRTGFPWMSPADGGLLSTHEDTYGFAWEDVEFIERCDVYTILVICNNDFSVLFVVPSDGMDEELRKALQEYPSF